jgi:hypothetical protein
MLCFVSWLFALWVDLVYWKSREDAEQAVKNAANSAVCRNYFQRMLAADHEDPGAGVLHLERIKTYTLNESQQ